MRRALRAVLGVALGLVARLWLATLRMQLEVHPDLPADRPWVLSFFHGTQWPLLAWKRRRATVVMVSLSDDGAMQARALASLGFQVVRGSSSRGGVRALAALVRAMRRGRDAAFAVDGPRGPYGEPKPGAILAAKRAGAVLVPMGSAIRSGKVFDRAWDRFALAWPFSRVAVVLGAPLDARGPHVAHGGGEGPAALPALGAAIRAANARAEAILAAGDADVVPLSGFSPAPERFPDVALNAQDGSPVQRVGSPSET
jgi:lysophospholipid acyltransferase (LPLAT)-like uncharacterized protein